jgi:hypothetical protein
MSTIFPALEITLEIWLEQLIMGRDYNSSLAWKGTEPKSQWIVEIEEKCWDNWWLDIEINTGVNPIG